jgi:hypothetical protein
LLFCPQCKKRVDSHPADKKGATSYERLGTRL